jgi:hypothetical protein
MGCGGHGSILVDALHIEGQGPGTEGLGTREQGEIQKEVLRGAQDDNVVFWRSRDKSQKKKQIFARLRMTIVMGRDLWRGVTNELATVS